MKSFFLFLFLHLISIGATHDISVDVQRLQTELSKASKTVIKNEEMGDCIELVEHYKLAHKVVIKSMVDCGDYGQELIYYIFSEKNKLSKVLDLSSSYSMEQSRYDIKNVRLDFITNEMGETSSSSEYPDHILIKNGTITKQGISETLKEKYQTRLRSILGK